MSDEPEPAGPPREPALSLRDAFFFGGVSIASLGFATFRPGAGLVFLGLALAYIGLRRSY